MSYAPRSESRTDPLANENPGLRRGFRLIPSAQSSRWFGRLAANQLVDEEQHDGADDRDNETDHPAALVKQAADIGAGAKLGPFEIGVAYDGFARKDEGYATWLAFKAGWRFGL